MPSTRRWLPIPWVRLDKMKKKHIFYTGPRGIGKSTLLQKRLAQFQGVFAGFRTVKVPCGDSFSVHMLPVDKKEMPAEENLLFCRDEKRAYEQNALRFNAIGCRLLADIEGAELIVMDELGSAESAAKEFQDRAAGRRHTHPRRFAGGGKRVSTASGNPSECGAYLCDRRE